jgi:hypothetical protein
VITSLSKLHLLKTQVHIQETPIIIPDTQMEELRKIHQLEEKLKLQDKIFELHWVPSCIKSLKDGFVIGFSGLPLILFYRINRNTDTLQIENSLLMDLTHTLSTVQIVASEDQ